MFRKTLASRYDTYITCYMINMATHLFASNHFKLRFPRKVFVIKSGTQKISRKLSLSHLFFTFDQE